MKKFKNKTLALYFTLRGPLLWINFILPIFVPRPYDCIMFVLWILIWYCDYSTYEDYCRYKKDIDRYSK